MIVSPQTSPASEAGDAEPGPRAEPTAAQMVARAEAMCPLLVERPAETERLTYYPEATHKEFSEAGFNRILVPKRYGGCEFDLTTSWRVIIALARGCPSSAWCFGLAAGHALMAGSLFEDDVQQELFGNGNFVCAAATAPSSPHGPVE